MKPTKQYILDHALKLFNKNGFVNVRLQHIADAAFVSIGHLAYHFKTKDILIQSIYDQLNSKQQILLSEFRVVPLFEDITRFLIAMYDLQTDYIFFYVDKLEIMRAFPKIHKTYQEQANWQLLMIEQMLIFNKSRGSFIRMEDKFNHALANQFYFNLEMWRYMVKIKTPENENLQAFLKDSWAILLPWCTPMGYKEYEQIDAL